MALVGKEYNKPSKEGVGRGKVALSFIIGLVLGSVVTWAALGNTALSPTMPTNTSELPENTTLTDSTSLEYIVVEDQLAGTSVLIKEIGLSASSWAVVHEDIGGVPGNALGAQRFDKGVHSGTIKLLRSTNVDQNYYVFLYRDNGDRKFDLETDSFVMDDEGTPVTDTFQAIRIDRKIN